ncbi:SLC13 family permease [candidate division KSB1 bacterium]|nr:SLC13 family permease [candidate division KSB1 bacterium]
MTLDMILTFAVLLITLILFIGERLRVDVVALLIMIALPWLGLITPAEAFSGLSSNAVVSIIAVLIIGAGVDRSGLIARLTRLILRSAGSSERRLTATISAAVGVISALMQNIGAVAVFLPAVLKIARSRRLSPSRLLMPIGFAGILGGTLTMIGSGPLIILNDLLRRSGQEPYNLFSVTPLGFLLLSSGIALFWTLGRFILPTIKSAAPSTVQQSLIDAWELPTEHVFLRVPASSPLIGLSREDAGIGTVYPLALVALMDEEHIAWSPWRRSQFAADQALHLLGETAVIERFRLDYGLEKCAPKKPCKPERTEQEAGFAEVIVPPRSPVIGKSIRELHFRRDYSLEPLVLLSGEKRQKGDFSDQKFTAGDTLVVYGRWLHVHQLSQKPEFLVLTPVETPAMTGSRPVAALICLFVGFGLALAGLPLALSLFTGALGMVLSGVVSMDEAYAAIDWRTVFLLAGLIPLGIAMEQSAAAAFTAHYLLRLLQDSHPLFLLASVGLLSTIFSLFMSNVAATVLLVPLVLVLGEGSGFDPRSLALLVAVCASNSFLLPTHQVNALLLSPGGYRNSDYFRAGGLMTLVFLTICVFYFWLP